MGRRPTTPYSYTYCHTRNSLFLSIFQIGSDRVGVRVRICRYLRSSGRGPAAGGQAAGSIFWRRRSPPLSELYVATILRRLVPYSSMVAYKNKKNDAEPWMVSGKRSEVGGQRRTSNIEVKKGISRFPISTFHVDFSMFYVGYWIFSHILKNLSRPSAPTRLREQGKPGRKSSGGENDE